MKRRTVLAASSLVIPAIGGCTGSPFGCPDPDIESSLTYDNYRSEARGYKGEDITILITSVDDVDPDLEESLEEEAIDYITDTDYNRSSIIVVQVGSSIGSDNLEVIGVGREDEKTVRAYTCVPNESGTDDWYPRTQLIRVEHEGQVPEQAVGTHYREDSEVTINHRG